MLAGESGAGQAGQAGSVMTSGGYASLTDIGVDALSDAEREDDLDLSPLTDMRQDPVDGETPADQDRSVAEEMDTSVVDPPPPLDRGTPQPSTWEHLQLTDILLKASHNSYEGDERGSILEQLNQGVRGLEIDVHDNDFTSYGYRIGHFRVGDAVDHSRGNPAGDQLADWLEHIDGWSRAHPSHAPLILTIDLKDDLTDNRSFAAGNLSHLNHIMEQSLSTLFDASEPFDSVEDLRGRSLCVLSGDQGTRLSYLYDEGYRPKVAISGDQLLEVHDSGSGHLWYWSGEVQQRAGQSAQVIWRRHGRYDTGRHPTALLIGQSVIEIHQSESANTLWYHIGTLSGVGELSLYGSTRFENAGREPSVRLISESPLEIAVRYRSNEGQLLERRGVVDLGRSRIDWGGSSLAAGPLYNNEVASSGAFRVSVGTEMTLESGVSPSLPPRALSYRLLESNQEVDRGLVRYRQRCFVEWQQSETSHDLLSDQLFGAVSNSNRGRLSDPQLTAHSMVRIWSFSHTGEPSTPSHLPASDEPLSETYQSYCERDPRWIE